MKKQIIIIYTIDDENGKNLTLSAILGKDAEDNDIKKVRVTKNVAQEVEHLLNQIVEVL